MRPPDDLPALTEAEARFVEGYLTAVDLLGRLNPVHVGEHAYRLVRGTQDLAAAAADLRAAAEDMWRRGEREVFAPTLVQAMLALDGARRTRRVLLEDPGHPPGG